MLRANAGRYTPKVAVLPVALFAIGAASASLYFWGRDLHRFTQWIAAYIGLFIGQLAFYVVACYAVFRWSDRSPRAVRWASIFLVIVFAVVFRAVLVPQRPYLSADVYRYAWDGRVQSAGINPYRYVPEAPELTGLQDERIFPNIPKEDRGWLSPYPPAAQMLFFGVNLIRPSSVTAFKAAASAFDLITILLLMLALARSGLDPARAIIFAWHPLAVFEGAHSGHVEAMFIAFLALAVLAWSMRRNAVTGVALALAALVKFYPVLLLPVLLVVKPLGAQASLPATSSATPSSQGWLRSEGRLVNKSNLAMLAAFVATITLAYAPYLSAGRNLFGFLRGYVVEEGFVQGGARYFLLDAVRKLVAIPTDAFLILGVAGLIAAGVWLSMRVKRDAVDLAGAALAMIGLFLILTTPRYPWYYLWLIPFLCFLPRMGWLYLTCAPVLLYALWYTPLVYPQVPLWLGACIFVPAVAWVVWSHLNERLQASRSPDRETQFE